MISNKDIRANLRKEIKRLRAKGKRIADKEYKRNGPAIMIHYGRCIEYAMDKLLFELASFEEEVTG